MTELLLRSLLVALVSTAVLDVWLEGSIFASLRAEVEAWAELWGTGQTRGLRLIGFFATLASCRFCLSYHLCFWVAVIILGPFAEFWGWLKTLLVTWLAAVAMVTLLDKLWGNRQP